MRNGFPAKGAKYDLMANSYEPDAYTQVSFPYTSTSYTCISEFILLYTKVILINLAGPDIVCR